MKFTQLLNVTKTKRPQSLHSTLLATWSPCKA